MRPTCCESGSAVPPVPRGRARARTRTGTAVSTVCDAYPRCPAAVKRCLACVCALLCRVRCPAVRSPEQKTARVATCCNLILFGLP